MAGRGRTSSQKRRKEQNRLEKRQTKAERKANSKDKGSEQDDLVVLQGPVPIEYDPDLDRGLTPDLVSDTEEPEHAAS
jgi:hypothetical protein